MTCPIYHSSNVSRRIVVEELEAGGMRVEDKKKDYKESMVAAAVDDTY